MTDFEVRRGARLELSEYEISLKNESGTFSTYPLEIMDVAVEWFEAAIERDWKYYDARGIIICPSQLDEYIKRLQKVSIETRLRVA